MTQRHESRQSAEQEYASNTLKARTAALVEIHTMATSFVEQYEFPQNESFARIAKMAFEAIGCPTQRELDKLCSGLIAKKS